MTSDAEGVAQDQLDLRVQSETEGDGPVRVIRLRPLAPMVGNDRPRDRGPFGPYLELLEELRAATSARCRATGIDAPGGLVRRSWGPVTIVCPAADLDVLRAALAALLDGDEMPVRAYLRSPPPLTPRGTPWEPPDGRF